MSWLIECNFDCYVCGATLMLHIRCFLHCGDSRLARFVLPESQCAVRRATTSGSPADVVEMVMTMTLTRGVCEATSLCVGMGWVRIFAVLRSIYTQSEI